MILKMTVPPVGLPLTVDEVKTHLRVSGTDEDAYLQALINVATEQVQNITNRQLMRATFELQYDYLPSKISLPYPPFAAITDIRAVGAADEDKFPADWYTVQGEPALLRGVTDTGWYSEYPEGVKITFTAGYETAEAIPAPIKQAMLLIIAFLYENREDGNDRFPKASEALLSSYRIYSF